MHTNTKELFLGIVRAGLWEHLDSSFKFQDSNSETCNVNRRSTTEGNVKPEPLDIAIDWGNVYQLASEQAVLGLVLAGIESLPNDQKPPKLELLQWIGEVQMLEQQNKKMNSFIAELVMKMRRADIYTLLVKGQGVAQCYERPLWRSCGDVDFLLSDSNYERAKEFLTLFAEHVDLEDSSRKHLGMTIGDWIVELHGTMHTLYLRRVNKGIDDVQDDLFLGGNVRSWNNNGTMVFLPSPDNDVILVFTHILEHFFIEGVGLKQVCDWCRLLWTNRDSLNYGLLEKRIRKMGLMTEWKAFASMAVDVLGMPEKAMPMYDSRFSKRGQRVLTRILKSGNMGHNNDLSYRTKYSGLTYKLVALWRRVKDFASFTKMFPIDAPRFFVYYVMRKV